MFDAIKNQKHESIDYEHIIIVKKIKRLIIRMFRSVRGVPCGKMERLRAQTGHAILL